MWNDLYTKLALIVGNWFSLDRKFRKHKAVARIYFVEGEPLDGSIKITMDGIDYYFEGEPKIEVYKNLEGSKVTRKTLKYGGWEMDLTAKENKILK